MKKQAVIAAFAMLLSSCSAENVPGSGAASKKDNTRSAKDHIIESEVSNVDSINSAFEADTHSDEHGEAVRDADTDSDMMQELSEEDYEYDTSDSYEEPYAYEESPDTVSFRSDSSGYIEWDAPSELPYSKAEILISGPDGQRLKRAFSPGENIALDEILPDGIYSWESVITPEVDPYVREEMQKVRELGDIQAETELISRLRDEGSLPTKEQANKNRQSGTFTVKDGIARPNTAKDISSANRFDG